MSSIRSKPYEGNPLNWGAILEKLLQIPMNQREYSWERPQLARFLDDLYKIFEEGKYIYKMGSIINLKYDGYNYIYDGQQRILTMIQILHVLGLFSEKLRPKIQTLLTVDVELDRLTTQQQKIKTDLNVEIVPKLFCVNPNDMKGLVDIMNDKVRSHVTYMECGYVCCDSESDDDVYKCNTCEVTVKREVDFIRHLTHKHNFVENPKTSKLYASFEYIYSYVDKRKYDEKHIINLWKFILNDIDVQFYDCHDPEYVSRIFDWENNRGKDVATLDLIKNPILVKIPDAHKFMIYDEWGALKQSNNHIYKDYGQKLFDIGIQLYNNKITRAINVEELFRPIIEAEDTYCEVHKFFNIVKKLINIMDQIKVNKFGRILNNSPRIQLNWEAYMWCLLPIFYKKGTIDDRILVLFCRWYFRKIGTNSRTFNNLC